MVCLLRMGVVSFDRIRVVTLSGFSSNGLMFLQELFQFGVTHALPLEAVTTFIFSSLPYLSVQRYNALLYVLSK